MKDYCTLTPDGIPFTNIYWGDCCKEHDDNFDLEGETFSEANDYLWYCIRRKGEDYKILADVAWLLATLFGYPWWIKARMD